jgi:PPOX class probable F420-dependent enzyme
LLDELYDAERRTPIVSAVEILGGMSHLLLVTFRRDGGRVATPVWAAAQEGRLYARTQRASGKVKRVRHNAGVLLVPCTTRGRPLGVAVPGKARVLSWAEESTAEEALREKYGFIRAACATIQDWLRVDMCYLEITLAASSPGRQTSA